MADYEGDRPRRLQAGGCRTTRRCEWLRDHIEVFVGRFQQVLSWSDDHFSLHTQEAERCRLRAAPTDGYNWLALGYPRAWRNWQTHQLEGLAGAIPWRFKSSRSHWTFRANPKTVCGEGDSPRFLRGLRRGGQSPTVFRIGFGDRDAQGPQSLGFFIFGLQTSRQPKNTPFARQSERGSRS
jgi:hypothetical protein